jgi:hypothetical protein
LFGKNASSSITEQQLALASSSKTLNPKPLDYEI